mmetsp:Transcript_15645/g.26116  ORF Transcript_15645/g.26116 Transcript_15645/m.26116 type:complete len:288 (-) Transcript_15645:146-1009(-)
MLAKILVFELLNYVLTKTMGDQLTIRILATLKLELAIVTIVAKPLIQVTYLLEGDSCTTAVAYDLIMQCKSWFDVYTPRLDFPRMTAAFTECATTWHEHNAQDGAAVPALIDHLKGVCAHIAGEAKEYFDRTVIGELAREVEFFRICRYSNPLHIKTLDIPNYASFERDVRSLNRFSDQDIGEMQDEWSRYVAACRQEEARDGDDDPDKVMARICHFWNARCGAFPALSEFVQYCFSIATSSAAAERIFSMLKRSFDKLQMVKSLEDTTQATLLLCYNEPLFDALLA